MYLGYEQLRYRFSTASHLGWRSSKNTSACHGWSPPSASYFNMECIFSLLSDKFCEFCINNVTGCHKNSDRPRSCLLKMLPPNLVKARVASNFETCHEGWSTIQACKSRYRVFSSWKLQACA